MTKFFSTLMICGALSVASLFAAEHKQDIAPNMPSVMFGYKSQTQDLLSIASNGAVTEQSEGVYVLSALEMQEVQGGRRFKKFWKKVNGKLFEGTLIGIASGISDGLTGGLGVGLGAGAAHGVVHTILSKR